MTTRLFGAGGAVGEAVVEDRGGRMCEGRICWTHLLSVSEEKHQEWRDGCWRDGCEAVLTQLILIFQHPVRLMPMDSEFLVVAKPACSKQTPKSSHLIQHIPCLEARSTNEVGDWKMVGWVVIVIQLHCCTPIWLWHALAKNSASFSSPLWFDGHFGRKETLLSGRAHLYISGVPDSESFGKSLGKIKRKP